MSCPVLVSLYTNHSIPRFSLCCPLLPQSSRDINIEVSTYSRVKINGIVTKVLFKCEYPLVKFTYKKEVFYVRTYRLAAVYWVDNKNPKEWVFVNHKNKKRYDGRVTNLEWVSPKENSAHGSGIPVIITNLKTNYSTFHFSIQEASRQSYGGAHYSAKTLGKALRGDQIFRTYFSIEFAEPKESIRDENYNEDDNEDDDYD